MDGLVMEFVKNGKSVNELMDMPYHFVIEILNGKNNETKEVKKEKSLISAFGG
jgi:hypothetical protein